MKKIPYTETHIISGISVEITLKGDIDGSLLQNLTHISFSDDTGEILFHHKDWTFATPINRVESMVIRK